MAYPHLTRMAWLLFSCFALVTDLAAADRPNILFCIADDASYPHMGAYGTSWVETPAFDRIAREGLLFQRAYTPNAKCAPSRACILTGRNSWQLEEAANHWCYFPEKFRVYTEVLAEHGYHVGSTGKGWAPGVSPGRALAGQAYNRRRMQPPAQAISNLDYAANFGDFLDDAKPDQPWCFWYGGYEPHRAYEYGAGVNKGGKKLAAIQKEEIPGFWPDNETVRTDMLDYAFEIEYFDQHLGRMLEMLDRRGMRENTLIVVTADNGMPFPRIKGQEYEMSNHLPLAVRWPAGIEQPGRVVEDYVSFIDFAPTFLEAAGVAWEDSAMAASPGRSLTDVFAAPAARRSSPHRTFVLIGKERHDIGRPHDAGYPIRGLVEQDWLYVRNYEPERWPAGNPETGYLNCDGSPTKTLLLKYRDAEDPQDRRWWSLSFARRPDEELYDVAKDPYCLRNLAEAPEHAERKEAMRSQMEQRLRAQQDPRMEGRGEVFDAYPYAGKAHRGFYERYRAGEKIRAGWVNPGDFQDPE